VVRQAIAKARSPGWKDLTSALWLL